MTDLFDAVIESIEDPAPGIRILRMRTLHHVTWQAGQYMEVHLDGFPSRPYSIASAQNEGVIEFHIRSTGSGGASDHLLKHISVGDSITLRGPFGRAVIPKNQKDPVILIAGGTGVSPFKSIVDTWAQDHKSYPVTLFWGVREEKELYLRAHFEGLVRGHNHFSFYPVCEHGNSSSIERGNVADTLIRHSSILQDADIFLSGPPGMVQAVLPILKSCGIGDTRIHTDERIPKAGT